ncbi:hypothetical protein TMatcc_002578 [Talaromyces marneffei ATCC 18224]|uniref:Uncharacterized protein n=1 Tax=Talaromyces marneffei (strain ATCC 18224 / CBS 334.59 / QM 7333) TaxID=441960 RepID=B6Q2V9_TALMQ|nr:uncharacterized protein EYB26_002313 [Talaromyces marneffei]EEA29057.1 conserved hypothetical protein [Talaromyces marneffei ATCC 18224]KAE8555346.1 hypothetical protein EYB25_000041 [Talaromyces marneffei]QGA14657.1 hypothetical protein EYB26_002313 [Talaromyces marneffei]
MENIRLAVRQSIQAGDLKEPVMLDENADHTSELISLYALWMDVSAHLAQDAVNENILATGHVLRNHPRETPLTEEDKKSAGEIYAWLARLSLPSSKFAASLEANYSANKDKESGLSATLKAQQTTYTLAISCIRRLNDIVPILEVTNPDEIFLTLLSFTSPHDPWTTDTSLQDAVTVLQSYMEPERQLKCWAILERVCESKIRPIFAKTKNPSITASGRKNLHPLPQPRFDESLFDPEAKPWKHKDVYTTTVLEWILAQYTSSDINRLENQFHFYVPPILSLIDDESSSFKYRGCNLLIKFLTPIRESDSDLLRRTNLSSVFDDALTSCLLSLPTITPEDESLQLLGVAYPALLLTLKARCHTDRDTKLSQLATKQDDRTLYITRLITLLRDNVISSFHHVSSYSPASANEEISSLASFPYPRLSTFLLHQLAKLIQELGIHTTKYLQEIVPVVYSTLSNPFGTAYMPLLLAGIATTQAVILNGHPRIWRYRGDLLAAMCQCWINVTRDESSTKDSEQKLQLRNVLPKLQGAVYLLKLSVRGATSTRIGSEEGSDLVGLVDDKDVNIDDDVKALVEVDEQLKGLLQIDDVDLDDSYFFK